MALQEIIARLGFQFDNRQLQAADKSIGGFIGRLQQYAGLIAGSLIVRGTVNFIDNITTQGDEIAKTSRQLGIGVNSLYAWQNAAEFAGASGEDLVKGLRTIAKRALDVDDGLKEAKDSFDRLGVSALDSNGNLKENEQLLRDVGLALSQVKNSTERTALAQELFGRSGIKLLPLFEQGEEGLDALLQKTKEFGIDLTQFAQLSEDARDRMKEWDIATFSLKATLITTFLPAINQVIQTGAKVIKWLTDFNASTNISRSAIIALGIALASKLTFSSLAGLARAAVLPALKFALLFLIVDELITLFEGGDTVIGKALDKIFGAGTKDTVVNALKGIGKQAEKLAKDPSWENLDNLWNRIFGGLAESAVGGADDLKLFGDLVKEDFNSFIDDISEHWPTMVWQVIADIIKIFTGVDLGPDGFRSAKEYVQGLIDGIKAGVGELVDAAGEMAKSLVKKVKDTFKERSPSKVGFESGVNMDRGIAMGLLSQRGQVARAFNTVAAPVVRSASISQRNQIPINIYGARDPVATGQQVGQQVASNTRTMLDEAANALIPVG